MSARPRFVFDTHAVISAALLRGSISRRAFDKALGCGKLLVSTETVEELNNVLARPDFAWYLTEDERLEFLAVLFRETDLVKSQARLTLAVICGITNSWNWQLVVRQTAL